MVDVATLKLPSKRDQIRVILHDSETGVVCVDTISPDLQKAISGMVSEQQSIHRSVFKGQAYIRFAETPCPEGHEDFGIQGVLKNLRTKRIRDKVLAEQPKSDPIESPWANTMLRHSEQPTVVNEAMLTFTSSGVTHMMTVSVARQLYLDLQNALIFDR